MGLQLDVDLGCCRSMRVMSEVFGPKFQVVSLTLFSREFVLSLKGHMHTRQTNTATVLMQNSYNSTKEI